VADNHPGCSDYCSRTAVDIGADHRAESLAVDIEADRRAESLAADIGKDMLVESRVARPQEFPGASHIHHKSAFQKHWIARRYDNIERVRRPHLQACAYQNHNWYKNRSPGQLEPDRLGRIEWQSGRREWSGRVMQSRNAYKMQRQD